MSSDPVNPNISIAAETSTSLPPHGLSPEAALMALHERNQKMESDNAFLQQQLENIRTLMLNDKEARERD